MNKSLIDLYVSDAYLVAEGCTWLRLTPVEGRLPEAVPGQFAQLRAPQASGVMLRRPVSIHSMDREGGSVEFLVQSVGRGSRAIASLCKGDTLSAILPLGNGFALPEAISQEGAVRPLLIGGGVGVAPLYFLGQELRRRGISPTFLFGARTKGTLPLLEAYRRVGTVHVATEDGSLGEQGFVTAHSLLTTPTAQPPSGCSLPFTHVYACGPQPMLKAVASWARGVGLPCQVSVEALMACGLGACLCCVVETVEGNLRTCVEGPVFDIDTLGW